MVSCTLIMMLFAQMLTIRSAPLQMQYQSQLSVQPTQEELLQHQLYALQQLQNLQNLQMMNELNNYYPQVMQRQGAPLMILLPEPNNPQINNWNQVNDLTKHVNVKTKNNDQKETDDDSDSIVIDAEPQMEPTPEPMPKRAILLIPNSRFSLGGLISAIPFLPIEINVPDTISWIYNGIAGIISGIGQRLPFKKPVQTSESDPSLRLLLKRLQNRNQNVPAPILMLPDVAQVYPMQF